MTRRVLREKITILETENSDLQNKINEFRAERYREGEHLKEHPFIPEYIGFEETILEDSKDDSVQARIYTKSGFNLSRPVNHQNKEWFILTPEKITVRAKLSNMLNAIVVLQSLGMDVSVEAYYELNKKLEKRLLDIYEGE